ncbi:MAG TPA: chorismate synthase [Syntrophomonadaceae bacterium]|nr:chorismate synthase [Syntrophomonadaceae bacterium]HOQ10657.1 chorismate synthase [Syntrophomonadaceae bacterium]HPU48187.1 chorismate synthase [Syntrophomonadaceae bacterium]
MLRFSTAGESHGPGLVGIIEGLPAGLPISTADINRELSRRQQGYGRGGRMKIEQDEVVILSGVRNEVTLGSPVSFVIWNRDYENWSDIMGPGPCSRVNDRRVTRPRPGHADLAGGMKYHHSDLRNVLERASARETAARVAAGAFFKKFLEAFDIYIYSQVIEIGGVPALPVEVTRQNLAEVQQVLDQSPVRCYDPESARRMMARIDQAREEGESLGGVFETGALGVPPGLGSHTAWHMRLDSRLAALMMSIPAIKAFEIGEGIANSRLPGSQVHDAIYLNGTGGIERKTNRAGGLEGGISNGETILIRAYMKPIPTLYKPLTSVNTATWQEEKAEVERSDICAVPAAAVVGEAMMAYGLAQAFSEKFAGDHMEELQTAFREYRSYLKKVWKWAKT